MAETITVATTGPIFDGRAPRAVESLLDEATWTVGTKALSQLHLYMDQFFKNPTPYYETQVTMERRVDDVVIHDRGIVYGPWLAGTSSRNRTTRFKGYSHWRRTVQDVQKQVPRIVQGIVLRHLGRMQ